MRVEPQHVPGEGCLSKEPIRVAIANYEECTETIGLSSPECVCIVSRNGLVRVKVSQLCHGLESRGPI